MTKHAAQVFELPGKGLPRMYQWRCDCGEHGEWRASSSLMETFRAQDHVREAEEDPHTVGLLLDWLTNPDVSPWRHALRTSVVVCGVMTVLVTLIIAIGVWAS